MLWMCNGFMDRNGRMERECRREIGSALRRTLEDVIRQDPPVVVGTDIYVAILT